MTDAALRLRTSRARAKAVGIIGELVADPAIKRLLLIAGRHDDVWTVVCGGMTGRDMAESLVVASQGLRQMTEHERNLAKVSAPLRMDISERGTGPIPGANPPAPQRVHVGENGDLAAPEGEQFTVCGQCGGSRWYATGHGMGLSRLCCVGCLNELALIATPHEAGHA